jgi:hypothetical protein
MTKEDRIFAHYKSLKNNRDVRRYGVSIMWMTLARKWQMPIREIKALIADMKETKRALQNPPRT